MTDIANFWEGENPQEPPNPEKVSRWSHKQPGAPQSDTSAGHWVPTFYGGPAPLGNSQIVGATYHWQSDSDQRRSLAEVRESGRRLGARYRRFGTPTRVRIDRELGIEVEV